MPSRFLRAFGHPATVGILIALASGVVWWSIDVGSPVAGVLVALLVPGAAARAAGFARGLAAAGALAAVIAVLALAGVGDTPLDALEVGAVYGALAASAAAGARWGSTVSRSKEREGALAEARKELVKNVSHELRTPLAVIQGLLTTLFQHWDALEEPAKLDLIDSASSNVASLDASVLHFIDAGRIERGDVDVALEPVELAQVVEQAEHKLATVLAGYEVKPELKVDRWVTDGSTLGRILELYLENAARFSPVGSVITVQANEKDGKLELAVVDRGKGVPPTVHHRVFEPFWREDVAETGVSRGAGLGLYVAKRLAEHLGAEVGFTSVKGRGSRFFVLVPASAVPG